MYYFVCAKLNISLFYLCLSVSLQHNLAVSVLSPVYLCISILSDHLFLPE